MASAVTVIFGANSTQFQAELARMQAMTLASSRKMSDGTFGGHVRGMSTLIREGVTIPREVLEGRGMGRIIASMSIFVSALASVAHGSQQAASYTSQLADGYERLALQANLAATAALKKAEATAADAYAEGLEDEATIAAAEADAVKAKTAQAAAVAAQEKAIAARKAATAEEMEAVAAGEATAASLPLLAIFLVIIAVAAILYGSYKIVSGILHTLSDEKIKAAEQARKLSLTFEEEAAVLEKLSEAADKTADAIRKMSAAHDEYAKRVDEAVDGQKNLYEHTKKLADLKKDGDLTSVDIAEKKGTITHEQAVKQKAEIEKKANSDAAAAKTDELLKERDMLSDASVKADAFAKKKQTAAQSAADALDTSPEGKANALELAALEKREKQIRKDADEAADAAVKLPEGPEKDLANSKADTLNTVADIAAMNTKAQRAKMKPDELAAADAMTAATEATSNSKSISEKHAKAVTEWANQVKNSPSELAAENKNIDLKAQDELLGNKDKDARGYDLNSQQKIGAYAATAPILLQQLNELRGIKANTAPHSPPNNHPPGERKPQLGTKPQRHQHGIDVSYR